MKKKEEEEFADNEKYESVKRKVFREAVSVILEKEFGSDSAVGMGWDGKYMYSALADINTILSVFPDERRMSEERSWLPMHFAIVLANGNKISEDDVHVLLSGDPLAMHQYSLKEVDSDYDFLADFEDYDEGLPHTGCTPAHILFMQKQPKMSLVKYLTLRDPKAFLRRDQRGRYALHLVAEYSESLELLQHVLQIDCKMTKEICDARCGGEEITPLGLLCRRLAFPNFEKMVSCLTQVDSSVEVIYDGIIECLTSYRKCLQQNISPGSRDARSLILIGNLLNANPLVLKITNSNDCTLFHGACRSLRGELGVAVMSLFLTKDRAEVRANISGNLPIHCAAANSCLGVLKLIHKEYPESISILGYNEKSLLNMAIGDDISNIADRMLKVRYLCDQFPALIQLKFRSFTPLHWAFMDRRFSFKIVKILCDADIDRTVIRQKGTPPDTERWLLKHSGKLPLHFSIQGLPEMSEVSDEGDCFRLLLNLCPAAAGIKDNNSQSPYDIAVSRNMSTYYIRLLLHADPSIDPVKRGKLNFTVRREGMFLAFRALSRNIEPSIWSKIRYEDIDLLKHIITYL
jgi:hypothetical protein